jgi:murein L,D-transpeptidase YafK
MPTDAVPTSSRRPASGIRSTLGRLVAGAAIALLVAGCQADEEMSLGSGPKHLREVPFETRVAMSELNMAKDSPVLMRIFKEEDTFEVWKKDRTGKYALLKTYEICKWSGKLGPKIKEGDRQAPEGYYKITPALMNPNSSYHLAFNTGYPNAFDRSHDRTGAHLMVHGACSSRGCYAMSDAQIQEIYALARDAFRGGQTGFQLAAYPFRMTPENMARHIDDPNMPFWRMLKEGYDHFELTRQEPKVDVCGRKYVFNVTADGPLSPTAACPALKQPETLRIATAKKQAEDDKQIAVIAARLAEEKREAEERAIALAAKEEDRLRREQERQIALAARDAAIAERTAALAQSTQAFAAMLGLAAAPAEASIPPGDPAAIPADAAAAADAVAATEPTAAYSAEGAPLPRRDPRAAATVAVMAPEVPPASTDGSMFTRLFTFGDGDGDEAALPAAPAAVEAAVPGTPAGVVPDAAPSLPGVATDTPGAGPACDPAVAAEGANCAAPVASAPVTASAEDRSIMDRIGSWF